MMTCRQWVMKSPWKALLAMASGFGMTVIFANIVWTYQRELSPGNPVMIGAPLVTPLADGSRELLVRYALKSNGDCVRQGAYTMARFDGREPRYHPLGSFLNGVGAPDPGQRYGVEFNVPSDLAPGEWIFSLRVHYTCPLTLWFHPLRPPLLLVNWDWFAPPVPINLP